MSFNVHDNLKNFTLEELKAISQEDRLNFSICLMNLEHDLNIGNCIRSAHILGARTAFIFGKRKFDSRSTVGAHNYIDVVRIEVDDLEDRDNVKFAFESMVKMYNLYPIMIDKTPTSLSINGFGGKVRPGLSSVGDEEWKNQYKHIRNGHRCLVFGNEQMGIPEYLMYGYPQFHIEQRGVIRSMNVASAAAIAMFEYSKDLLK